MPRTVFSVSEPQVDDPAARASRARAAQRLTVQAEQRREEQRQESEAANRLADEEEMRETLKAEVSSTIYYLH